MACRIFIADDVASLRALWRVFLAEDPDLEIVGEAADGAEALDGVRATDPDVLLLDLSMPRVDGLEVMRALRDEQAGVRVLVVSGFSTARLAPVARELGAVGYFEKGGSADELRRAVADACEASHRFGVPASSTDG